MTHPLTPREKVRKAIIDVMKPKDADITLGRVDTCTDAILTALASSGDHAELARAIDRLLPITIQNTPDYAEVSFGECRAQAMTMEPETWLALNQLPALIAEVAARRGERDEAVQVIEAEREDRELVESRLTARATEAERKLAEAVGLLREARDEIQAHADGATPEWQRRVYESSRADYAQDMDIPNRIDAFLSKEAERG
ncbi:hypothetical protein [Brevundimonas sanguinis]|uniref:hypothetical protein n=1 Tax=Brevundimonas sanguinis TaxID=3021811 RepID=UPI0024158686|nr:hypothetical protein [Brevundimonas sp. NCCP 15609]